MKRGLFTNKNFILLAQGQGVSNIGNAVHNTAVAWYILQTVDKSYSGLVLSLYAICILVPIIISGPFAGIYVDRLNRKTILLYSDIINGILFIALSLLTYINFFPLISLFIISIISSFFFSFFNPAVNSVIPEVVDNNDLVKSNSIIQLTSQISTIAGAAVSGLLYQKIGIIGIFLLNGCSFIISGSFEYFLDIQVNYEKVRNKTHILKDMLEGFIYVKNNRSILILFIYFFLFCFAGKPFFSLIIPKIINYNLKLDATYFGYFNSFVAAGGIAGMLLVPYLTKKRFKQYLLFISSNIAYSLLVICFAIPILPSIINEIMPLYTIKIYFILGFIMMVLTSFVVIPLYSIFQKNIPNEFLGRFFAIYYTCVLSATPVGSLIFGSLSDIFPEYSIVLCIEVFPLNNYIFLLFVYTKKLKFNKESK